MGGYNRIGGGGGVLNINSIRNILRETLWEKLEKIEMNGNTLEDRINTNSAVSKAILDLLMKITEDKEEIKKIENKIEKTPTKKLKQEVKKKKEDNKEDINKLSILLQEDNNKKLNKLLEEDMLKKLLWQTD